MRARHALFLCVLPLVAACVGQPDPAGDPGPLGEAQDALKVCPGSTTLKGVDVSHYDGTITWSSAKAAGIDFAIAKATEATTYTDPTFATNWAGMKQAGVVRGAYHFFRANVDPIQQADHYLSVVTLSPGDLPPALDLETTDGETGATIAANAIQWLDHVAAATGMKPILYSSPSFISGTLGSPAGFETHAQLWVANWGVTCPDVPAPFTTWPFWQYSATGTVNGIPGSSGAVDLDEFNGDLAALMGLTKPAASSSSSSSSGSTSSSSSSGSASSSSGSASSSSGSASSSSGGTGGSTGSSSGGTGGSAGGTGAGSTGSGHPTGTIGTPGTSVTCAAAPAPGGSGESAPVILLALGAAAVAGSRRRRR